jgi:hypothetical protein
MTTVQNLASRSVSEYVKSLVGQISTVKSRVDSVLSSDGLTLTVANVSADLVNVDTIALNDKINGTDITTLGTASVMEDCLDATIQAGTLYHDATFNSVSNYIVLTNELASSAGQIEYIMNPGSIWTSEFEWQYVDTGGAPVGGALWLFMYNQSSISDNVGLTDTSGTQMGFSIVFDAAANQIRIHNAGVPLTTVAGPGFGAATWFNIKVVCENSRNFYVYVNGINYINYRAAVFTTTGAYAGFAAHCAAFTDAEYHIRNIKIYSGANYIANSLSTLGDLTILPLTGFSVAGALAVGGDLTNTGAFATSGGIVNIGADVTNNAINVGTNSGAARTITIGHNAGTNTVDLAAPTVNITAATASTNTTTGALVVTGGVAVTSGDVNLGADLNVTQRSTFGGLTRFSDHTHGLSYYELADSQHIQTGYTPVLLAKSIGASASLTGSAVDVSDNGDFTCVGAPGDTGNIGRATIFEMYNASFEVLATFVGGSAGDLFGSRVAMSGDAKWVAITAPGAAATFGNVYIYENVNNAYLLRATFSGPAASSSFGLTGLSMSSDGHIIMVGDPTVATNNGQVNIYELSDGTWSAVGIIVSPGGVGEEFGYAIALTSDGYRVAIGAPGYNGGIGVNTGKLYQRDRTTASTWVTTIGNDWPMGSGTRGGESVAISGDGKHSAFGGPAFGANQGFVTTVVNYGTGVTTFVNLAPITGAGNLFGTSLSISKDGSYIYASAPGYGGGAGRVVQYRMYNRRIVATSAFLDGDPGDAFGTSIAVSRASEALIVGGPNDGSGGSFAWFGGPGSFIHTGAGVFTGALITNGAFTSLSAQINGTLTATGITNVSNATASTDSVTGALTVTGGVGIGGDVHIGGQVDIRQRPIITNVVSIDPIINAGPIVLSSEGYLYCFNRSSNAVYIINVNEGNGLFVHALYATPARALYSAVEARANVMYYGATDGIRSADFHNKSAPVFSGILMAHNDAILKTWGQYLIALVPGTNLLVAANVESGAQVASVTLPGATPHYNILIFGDVCYVVNSGAAATVSTYNLNTLPTSITLLGTTVTAATMGSFPKTISMINNNLYLAGNGTLYSYNVISPTTIFLRTSIAAAATPTMMEHGGGYLYIAQGSVFIYDCRSAITPTLVGTHATGVTTIRDMMVYGQDIFITGDSSIERGTLGGAAISQINTGSIRAGKAYIDEDVYVLRSIRAGDEISASSGVLYTGLHVGTGGVSTSTVNGALTVNGGVGVTGDIFIGGNIEASNFVTDIVSGSTRLNKTGQLGTNSFIAGYQAGNVMGGADGNTLIGAQAGNTLTSSYNTGVGSLTMFHLTSGQGNTGFGRRSCFNIESGSFNTCIGYQSYSDGGTAASNANSTCIGHSSRIRASNEFVIGNTSTNYLRSERNIGTDLGTLSYQWKDLFLGNAIKMQPTTTPAGPSAGWVYYDSGTNKLRVYNGTTWFDCF